MAAALKQGDRYAVAHVQVGTLTPAINYASNRGWGVETMTANGQGLVYVLFKWRGLNNADWQTPYPEDEFEWLA